MKIQALRGVAILGVLAFHTSEFFPLGYLGVDVFFVISGFLMAPRIMQLIKSKSGNTYFDYSEMMIFFKKRFRRLSPALGSGLIFTAVVSFFYSDPHELHRISMQGIFTILLIGNIGSQRYAGDYFHPNPIPLIHTWSLSAEEQIYIFIPIILIILMLFTKEIKFLWSRFFLSLFVFSFVGTYFLDKILNLRNETLGIFGYYSPFAHLWQFSLGALTYLYSIKTDKKQKNLGVLGVIFHHFCCILVLVMLLNPNKEFARESLFISLAITAYALLNSGSSSNTQSKLKFLVLLGEISYPLYIFHLPVLYFFTYSPSAQFLIKSDFVRTFSSILVFLLLSIACYFFVEKKSRKQPTTVLLARWTLVPLILLFVLNFIPQIIFDRTITPSSSTKSYSTDFGCDERLMTICRLQGNNEKNSILVVGDSHARALAGSIVSSGLFSGENVFASVNDACRFSIIKFEDEDSCLLANKATLSWIQEYKPKLVVIAGRALNPDKYRWFWNRKQSDFINSYSAILRVSNANLVLVGPNREFQPSDLFLSLVGKSKGLEDYSQKETSFLESASKGLGGRVEFLNPNTILCQVNCGRKALKKFYFDNDHLNSLGTDRITRALAQKIQLMRL